MNKYIFITLEGFTFQPGIESIEPNIDNMQVLGFGMGDNAKEALENMAKENEYLAETNFDEVIGIQLQSETRECFSLRKFFAK